MKPVMQIQNIHKEFRLTRKQKRKRGLHMDTVVAVEDISFNVYEGEILCILGVNGAGKTTTLQILSTLLKPDSGTVLYDGENIKNIDEKIREKIAFLSAEIKLDEFFSADYLYDYFSNLYGVKKEVAQSRKKVLFDTLGIESFSHIKIGNLSTGMKQKVALALSLVHDPEVLILDEPTNGLDIIASRDVVQFLLQEKKRGKTIIVSTHIFELVDKLADRIIMIDSGQIIYEGDIGKTRREGGIEAIFLEKYDGVHEG